MKIAISTSGSDLDAAINPRFGRCDYFLIADTETGQVEGIPNNNRDATGGAGIQAATFILSTGAQAVITGKVGPNAMDVFKTSGVQVITGVSGTAGDALESFKTGNLSAAQADTAAESASGRGRGGGGGGGGGRGRRRM